MDILTTEGMAFIKLWLEYEAVTFPSRAILSFEIRDALHQFPPEVCEVAPELERLYDAQSTKIRIKTSANRIHWRDKADGRWSYKKSPFEIICSTSCVNIIEISYRDGREMKISVPWESFEIDGMSWLRDENMFQKVWIDERGCLNISIDKSNREEMFQKQKANAPIFMTKDKADMHSVLLDYSDFDFTKIPLLYSEEQFQAYSAAFMDKFGNNACIRNEMEEEGITEQELARDKMVDGQNVYLILEIYNSVRCMMGHEILGFKEEDDWEDY